MNLCRGCNKNFRSLGAYDMHRTGNYRQRTRRCKTDEEMIADGMRLDDKGTWRGLENSYFQREEQEA